MDALRVAAGDSHLPGFQPDYLAVIGHQHHLCVAIDLQHADDFARALGHVHRDHALATAMGQAVFGGGRALAEAVFRNGQQGFVIARDRNRHHLILR
jgi:hypothetical protein